MALAEATSAYQCLSAQTKSREECHLSTEQTLRKEVNDLRISSQQETEQLRGQVDDLMQDKAALQVQMEQLQLRCDLQGTEKRTQIRDLRVQLANERAWREQLQQQSAAQKTQLDELAQEVACNASELQEARSVSRNVREMELRTAAEVRA